MDLELFSLSAEIHDTEEQVVSSIYSKFQIYKGFDVRTLDFNQEYIVMSGCQLMPARDVSKDFRDECGLLVYQISESTTPIKTDILIKGGVSDRKLKGFLYNQ